MNFDEVHKMIPYATGELHTEEMYVYSDVRVKYPGKHQLDTTPIGGDFVVEAKCELAKWDWKQFSHVDIFKDIEGKTIYNPELMKTEFAPALCKVVMGEKIPFTPYNAYKLPGVAYQTLLEASQCLAVAEHRRYHMYEAGGGGRFLPVRFALGVIHGHWTAKEASKVQKRGIHGLRELTKPGGNPPTIKRTIKESSEARSNSNTIG